MACWSFCSGEFGLQTFLVHCPPFLLFLVLPCLSFHVLSLFSFFPFPSRPFILRHPGGRQWAAVYSLSRSKWNPAAKRLAILNSKAKSDYFFLARLDCSEHTCKAEALTASCFTVLAKWTARLWLSVFSCCIKSQLPPCSTDTVFRQSRHFTANTFPATFELHGNLSAHDAW